MARLPNPIEKQRLSGADKLNPQLYKQGMSWFPHEGRKRFCGVFSAAYSSKRPRLCENSAPDIITLSSQGTVG